MVSDDFIPTNLEWDADQTPAGSRGPAVLDDFTASYGYKFSDAAGYQWNTASTPNKL